MNKTYEQHGFACMTKVNPNLGQHDPALEGVVSDIFDAAPDTRVAYTASFRPRVGVYTVHKRLEAPAELTPFEYGKQLGRAALEHWTQGYAILDEERAGKSDAAAANAIERIDAFTARCYSVGIVFFEESTNVSELAKQRLAVIHGHVMELGLPAACITAAMPRVEATEYLEQPASPKQFVAA